MFTSAKFIHHPDQIHVHVRNIHTNEKCAKPKILAIHS